MLKGKYTVDIYDNKTKEIVESVESNNIIYTKFLEENLASVYTTHPFFSTDFTSVSSPKSLKLIASMFSAPNNIVLSSIDRDADQSDNIFNGAIIGYCPKNNTSTSNYNSKQGFLESASFTNRGLRFVFKFPDITANGTFNSIMMCSTSTINNNNTINIGYNVSSLSFSSNNIAIYKDEMYEFLNGYILKRKPFDFYGPSTKFDFALSTASTNDYCHNLIKINNEQFIVALSKGYNVYDMHLTDENFNIISSIERCVTGKNYRAQLIHDSASNIVFVSSTKKLEVNNNILALTDITESEKTSPYFTIINSSTGNAHYIHGQETVFDTVSGKTFSSVSGEVINTNSYIIDKGLTAIKLTSNSSSSAYNMLFRYKIQPFSYTKLSNPITKTNDKFMKITYEASFASPVFDRIGLALESNINAPATLSLKNESLCNPLDFAPPIDLHPDEPYGGLIE